MKELETFTASLGEGEHFQKLEVNSSWFIEKLKLTSNTGNVFGPFGGEGGEDKRPHRSIRKGVNPKHVYLDGVRGYVVRAQGAKALNRVSFKWSIVMEWPENDLSVKSWRGTSASLRTFLPSWSPWRRWKNLGSGGRPGPRPDLTGLWTRTFPLPWRTYNFLLLASFIIVIVIRFKMYF